MMSKFNSSWTLKGNDRPALVPQPPKTTAEAPTGSPNVDGGGGGLPSSAYGPTDGQQQNGAGGQQPLKPSTAPTASLMAPHGVEQLLTNTAPKAGATANPSSYGEHGSYPSATPEPRTKHNRGSAEGPERTNNQKEEKRLEMKPEHHTFAEKDNKREVKDHDNHQMIPSPSMSTQSQGDKVLPRSKTKERTPAPADPPASWSPQDGTVVAYIVVPNKQVPWAPQPAYNQNKELQSQDARLQRKESKTRDDKAQGGTTARVQRAASKPRDEIRQTNGTDSQQQASGFDRPKESNDPYNGMGARQVGNPAPSTSIPPPNEPSWVSMPSQKQNSHRLGVQDSNEPYTYNNRQTSSKDRAAGATQMGQGAPGGTPLTAPSQEIQDRKSPTRSPAKTNIQQTFQPVKEEKKGCPCSIL